ncbi:MAG: ribonucleoside triphosphate reductase, partial [Candidatus Pacebacteria bacterium]|nr:ribonucleoside triphosphate reductase [Candidatus Paceibacterota bacterium]
MTPTKPLSRIQKRNGDISIFNPEKIVVAISKAGTATKEFAEPVARKFTKQVLKKIKDEIGSGVPSVEFVQDIVEDILIASKYKKTAKAYILYREQHSKMREIISTAQVDLIDQYLKKLDWQVNENSNMGYSLQGLNNYVASEISKVYWLNKVYPKEIRTAHTEGDFHIHDLSLLSVYCVGWSLEDLLLEGFGGVSGKIECAPAAHFRSALGQIVNFFYTLQGEAAGAQAFSNFDTLLAPFIRYDKLSYKEVKNAIQGFVFNINVPTRVGFQTPFTNITMDLTVPENYKNQSVIFGGKIQNENYGDFQKEMDLLNKAFLEVMTEGDAKGRVFTFPIPTYNITPDFDWENENIETLWEATAKYGIPYFSNYVNSDMSPDDARSMCCRLRIDNRQLERRGGGLFGAHPLTGSIGVVTINMPRIGKTSKNKKQFYARLE